jgi:hypothetical protein
LDARNVKGERLIRCRNPWGEKEWNGRWSDGSKEWNTQLLKDLNYKFGNDGSFWISLEDFINQYNRFYVIRLYHDNIGKIWNRFLINGNWKKGETAGGCANFKSWTQNIQFGIKPKKNTRVFFELTQTDTYYNGIYYFFF